MIAHPRGRRERRAISRRSAAAVARQRAQRPGVSVSALNTTAGVDRRRRRSRASSRSVSRRGTSAARVTTMKRVCVAIAQQRLQLADRFRDVDELGGELTRAHQRAVLQQHAQQHLHPLARRVGHLEQPQRMAGRRRVDDDRGRSSARASTTERMPNSSSIPGGARFISSRPMPEPASAPTGRRQPTRQSSMRRQPTRSRRAPLRAARAAPPAPPPRRARARCRFRGPPRDRARRVADRLLEHVARASAPGSVDSSSTFRDGSARASRSAAAAATVVLPTPPLPPKNSSEAPSKASSDSGGRQSRSGGRLHR